MRGVKETENRPLSPVSPEGNQKETENRPLSPSVSFGAQIPERSKNLKNTKH